LKGLKVLLVLMVLLAPQVRKVFRAKSVHKVLPALMVLRAHKVLPA
jgi:hypothetical protein